MNSTVKTSLVVVGVVVLLLLIVFAFKGWSLGSNDALIMDQNSAADNGADTNTPDATGTTGSNPKTSSSGTNSGAAGAQQTPPMGLSDSALAMIISNSLIRVPQTGVDVALTAGEADFTDSYVKGHVSIGRVLAKVPTDSGYDVFAEMTITKEGTPSLLRYVALFRNVNQSALYTSSTLVGDRVALISVSAVSDPSATLKKPLPYMVSAVGYTLNVSYLDRKNGQPLTTEPSVTKTASFHVKNHFLSR